MRARRYLNGSPLPEHEGSSIPEWFTTASTRGLVDYDLNGRTRNNGGKLIVKHFKKSVTGNQCWVILITQLKLQQPGMFNQIKW